MLKISRPFYRKPPWFVSRFLFFVHFTRDTLAGRGKWTKFRRFVVVWRSFVLVTTFICFCVRSSAECRFIFTSVKFVITRSERRTAVMKFSVACLVFGTGAVSLQINKKKSTKSTNLSIFFRGVWLFIYLFCVFS